MSSLVIAIAKEKAGSSGLALPDAPELEMFPKR